MDINFISCYCCIIYASRYYKKLSNNKDCSKVKIIEFREEQEEIINSFNLRAIGTQCKDSSKIKCVIGLEKELNNLMDIINKNKE